ncbi:hypothetical protein JL720_13608 [Aureococcus anophagefferens]|nr:hypothetical protein JL720_13608 [Aureococcus anophagefferens]
MNQVDAKDRQSTSSARAKMAASAPATPSARVVSSWPVELLFRTPGLLTRAKVPWADVAARTGTRPPGAWHGVPLPGAIADLDDAAWLTRAFRACGTLGNDNAVARVFDFEVLAPQGQYAAGGAGEKALFAVEYAKPAPHLHTRLFAKVPWGANNNRSWRERISCGSDADGKELSVYQFLGHGVLPFDVPKLYFADLDRQSTDYVVVTERFSFPPSDLEVMLRVMLDPSNRKELTAPLPGTTLPHREKFRDRYDPCPWPLRLEHYYGALMRCQGQLAAAAERGDFGAAATQVWGGPNIAHPVYAALYERPTTLGAWLFAAAVRCCFLCLATKPGDGSLAVRGAARRQGLRLRAHRGLFRALDVDGFEASALDAASYLPLFLARILFDPRLRVFAHANLQPDNAKFTMGDAKYEVLVAPFDWGGAGFGPCRCSSAARSGIPHETHDRHEDQFFIAYCDELCAGSGRRLDNNELRDLFRACDGAISALVAAYYVGTDVRPRIGCAIAAKRAKLASVMSANGRQRRGGRNRRSGDRPRPATDENGSPNTISCYGPDKPTEAAWHDYFSDHGGAEGRPEIEEDIDLHDLAESRRLVHAAMDGEAARYGGDYGRVALFGESQGGCTALDAATTHAKACVSGEPKPPGMAAKPPPQAPVPMDEDSDSELEGYA